jgi:Helix-turn-helix domain
VRDTGGWGRAGGTVIRQRDSALPDPPPNAKGPIASIETDNIGAFARDLRVLRSKAGLDYPDMAEKSHYTMRTLASAAGGLRLPTLPVLIAYVNACGGDVTEWEERWGKLVKSGKKGQAALPAAGTNTSNDEPGVIAAGLPGSGPGGSTGPGARGAGPVPPNAPPSGEVYVITSARPRDEHW